ncbi:hypothetical protein HPB47_000728 [Ixodes persulcatus]|uniref:Uncharacterized protein n=1 Tax=Ixodes persulcatus TaxID=34615 RepID=A0AC60PQY5_IXOPE|nr:hypothetical protein HPB47_000728 [Ixodes persulcatus]
MKLKKNQAAPPKPAKVGGGKPRKLPKPAKTNDDDAVESDTEDYLKVNVTPKAAKVPAAELGSDEDDPELDDEDLDDEDELDEEDSLDDEEGDEDSEGGSDDEVPQLVAAKNKSKPKPAPPKKKAGQEESDDEDDEDDEDFDEDDSEDGEDEAPKAKGKPQLKDGGKAAKQPKRKGEEPAEQTSKKQKPGDGIPKSVYMDVDEYDKLFLYIGDLPPGCTSADVKALSPDIVDVRTNVKAGAKLGFMFAKFKSEAIADKNYKRLQGAQLNGQKLRVGYRGAKREGGLPANWSECHSELDVYGLPEGCPQDKCERGTLHHRSGALVPSSSESTGFSVLTKQITTYSGCSTPIIALLGPPRADKEDAHDPASEASTSAARNACQSAVRPSTTARRKREEDEGNFE